MTPLKLLSTTLICATLSLASPAIARDIVTLQRALVHLGIDPGPVDGDWGAKTRAALETLYETQGRSFSGNVGQRDYFTLARALQEKIESDEIVNAITFDFNDLFPDTLIYRVPEEYAFTNGADTPRFSDHAYSVPYLFVHDFNADGCDDILTAFNDSLAQPRVVFGGPDILTRSSLDAEPLEGFPATRTIRNVERRDVDGDGARDFVAFTAPHGWKQNELGRAWDDTESDVVYLATGEVITLPQETYAHGGLIGDVNGDGLADIYPIGETPDSRRVAYLTGEGGELAAQSTRVRALSNKVIFAGRSADLNGDGIDDFVFLTSHKYGSHSSVTPAQASEGGTFAVALGRPGVRLNDLQFTPYGSHWMDDIRWTSYLLSSFSDSDYDQGKWQYTSPSSIDLLDYDSDGDLDILVSYFVSANSGWNTSGFQIHRNDGGSFVDVTDEVAPWQPANRGTLRPTEAMFGGQLADIDADGDNDLVLSLQTNDQRAHVLYSGSVYLNDNGVFRPALGGRSNPFTGYRYLMTGDFDCNGRADLVGVGSKANSMVAIRMFLASSP